MNTTPRSVFSPRMPRTSISSSQRSSILPGSRKISSSRYSLSGRSNQSIQVVCKTPYHVVEGFGVPLPVPVTEALTFSDRNTSVSVCIAPDGWAWFVCGRRLLVWVYKQTVGEDRLGRSVLNAPCFELTLPPSDLAHKAELVAVLASENSVVPSCIAVSPEGTVRYWPSVQHEGVSVESSADLHGQECHALTNLGPVGCVLSTTTSTLLLVEPSVTAAGRHAVTCRPLRVPHGWLGLGVLGRRMSSLIFGGLPSAQVTETKLVKVVAARLDSAAAFGRWCVHVLSEQTLQKWQLSADEPEHLVYECEINQMVRETFHESVWESCAGTPGELDVWLMDMQPVEGGVMILSSAANTQMSPQLHYALGKLNTDGDIAPNKFITFCPLKDKGFYREDADMDLHTFQFLVVGQAAYLYNKKSILAVSAAAYNEEADTIEFLGSGDRLLGAALCGTVPVFFSKVHGLVSVSPADISPHDLLNSLSMSEMPSASDITISHISEAGLNISMTESELKACSIHKDAVTRLKAAFIHYIRSSKDPAASQHILKDVFPPEGTPGEEVGGVLDTTVVKLGEMLIDDIPVSDPRWAHKSYGAIGYASLQINLQLEDKSRALDLYVTFLKALNLWDRFGAMSINAGAMSTSYMLGEHAEKLVAAAALYKLQPVYGELIETVIRQVLCRRGESPSGGLSHQDLFYKEVSKLQEFFQELVAIADEFVDSDRSPLNVATSLKDINTVVLDVLQSVVQYRQVKADVYSPSTRTNPELCVYAPWTASSGSGGIKDSLVQLSELTLKYGARAAGGDLTLRIALYEQLVNLIDLILDGRKCQVESLRGSSKFDSLLLTYERERYEMIDPLIDDEEYERAAMLSEKYCDFEILIKMCEKSNNHERLDMYMEKFADHGFCQFLFSRYVQERQYGHLMELFLNKQRPGQQQEEFRRFLQDHPSLSWLQDVYSGRFRRAGETLRHLAHQEKELLRRKKAMVSLSKLAYLASGEPPAVIGTEVGALDNELDLVLSQENLPDVVVAEYGYDLDRFPVLSPVEVIKLFICDENMASAEDDFKKAFDLLPFVEDEFEREELKHLIWCQAILKDPWDVLRTDTPTETVQGTVFYRLVDLLLFYGSSPTEVLPPLSRLLESSELGALQNSNSFKYLLRVAYECFEQTMKDTQVK